MTREEAALKLSFHLMQCGMLMPIGWVDKNGDGSELFEAFKMAQDALREQPRWISVEERLPDDSFLEKEIIVCVLNRFGERNVYTKKFWGVNSALWNNDITHWMPLPEPPEVEV